MKWFLTGASLTAVVGSIGYLTGVGEVAAASFFLFGMAVGGIVESSALEDSGGDTDR